MSQVDQTLTLAELRARAVDHTLFPETTTRRALTRLPFIQADPIRAPARAQDLILRQRVKGYRAGDLERLYPKLELEEGFLYAYGFLSRELWYLRHPPNAVRLTRIEARLLEAVRRHGTVHPNQLASEFGGKRALNAWGSYSKVTKLALERLHGRGLLRVAHRENGIRVYAVNVPLEQLAPAAEVQRRLAAAVAQVLAPVREQTLRAVLALWGRSGRGPKNPRASIDAWVRAGVFDSAMVDGVRYLWPAPVRPYKPARAPSERVRLLAPFDPLVWDRRRFEQLFGWSYRFEAYTPLVKRVRGYYALPLLWRDQVIGWGNVSVQRDRLDVKLGFVGQRPALPEFDTQLDAEIERLRDFLRLGSG